MQKTQPLGRNLLAEKVDAGRIAARPGEAGDKSKLDRVFADAKYDRDRRGRSFSRKRSRSVARRGNNGYATTDEVSLVSEVPGMQQTPCTGCNDLLNHLIGAPEHCRRDRSAGWRPTH